MSGAIAAAAVGTLASAYMANKASKAAGSASDKQEAAAAEDLAFRREQYQRYLGLMGPIEERLAAEAKSTQPLDYEPLAAKTKENYAAAQRGITTAMGLRGMAGSGLDEAAIRGAAFGQASDLSKDWAQGLVNRRNLGMTLTGRGQIGQAAQGVSGGLQNLTNLYGSQANLYNQAASQGWENFGQGLSDLAYALGKRFGVQPLGHGVRDVPKASGQGAEGNNKSSGQGAEGNNKSSGQGAEGNNKSSSQGAGGNQESSGQGAKAESAASGQGTEGDQKAGTATNRGQRNNDNSGVPLW